MSYARRTENCDVYVFVTDGGFDCCGCILKPSAIYPGTDAIVAHLREHIAAGHKIPADLIPYIESHRDENEPFFQTGEWPEGAPSTP